MAKRTSKKPAKVGRRGDQRDVGRRLNALIVPNVRKAVRWNAPFYGKSTAHVLWTCGGTLRHSGGNS